MKETVNKARQYERRDCRHYETCLDKAARQDAPCVPCKKCRRFRLMK